MTELQERQPVLPGAVVCQSYPFQCCTLKILEERVSWVKKGWKKSTNEARGEERNNEGKLKGKGENKQGLWASFYLGAAPVPALGWNLLLICHINLLAGAHATEDAIPSSVVLTTGQPQPTVPSFHLPPPPKDAGAIPSPCGRINYLVMGRSVLAGVVAQDRCFSDCSSCYVLSLGFVQA